MILCMSDSVSKPCLITPWFLIHFISSSTIYLFINLYTENKKIIFTSTLIIHTIYEIKDIYFAYILKIYTYNNKFLNHWGNNSLLNSTGDTLGCLLGCSYVYIINNKYNKYNKNQLCLVSLINTIIYFTIFCYYELG